MGGDLLVMTYIKSAKDGLNLKENLLLWRVFCALVPCGNPELIFCPQPGALNCMEDSRKHLGEEIPSQGW